MLQTNKFNYIFRSLTMFLFWGGFSLTLSSPVAKADVGLKKIPLVEIFRKINELAMEIYQLQIQIPKTVSFDFKEDMIEKKRRKTVLKDSYIEMALDSLSLERLNLGQNIKIKRMSKNQIGTMFGSEDLSLPHFEMTMPNGEKVVVYPLNPMGVSEDNFLYITLDQRFPDQKSEESVRVSLVAKPQDDKRVKIEINVRKIVLGQNETLGSVQWYE